MFIFLITNQIKTNEINTASGRTCTVCSFNCDTVSYGAGLHLVDLAWSYNLFHHKAIALLVISFGYFSYSNDYLVAGIILFGHSAMDRILGYGLKYADGFKHTHLGTLK